jgi:DNA adenine methylase
MEVINDANGELITFYRCVRFHQDSLLTELEFVLNSREEFYSFRTQPGLTDIQRAARWFYRNKVSFGGLLESFGTGALGGGASHASRSARMEVIRALSHRLDSVCIEHLSWEKCVDLYDRPSTFFFLDPPYTSGSVGVYKGWTNTDVQVLRDKVDKLKGRWLVTLNDTAPIRAIFSGCRIRAVDRAIGIEAKGARGRRYKELIITSK